MRQWFKCALVMGLLVFNGGFSASVFSASANLQAAGQFTSKLANIKTLVADFHQTVKDGKGKVLQDTKGQMWVSRPLKFRWNANPPAAQQVVSNGQRLWVYDIDLEQATEQKLDKKVGNVPGLILSGQPETLGEHFIIQEEMQEGNARRNYILVPNDDDALFHRLVLTFEGNTPVSMEFEDHLGQRTFILFQNVVLNSSVSEKHYQFITPKGVDLVVEHE